MQRTTTTTERLLERKGMYLKFVLDYCLLSLLSFSVLFVVQFDGITGESISSLFEKGLLVDSLILGGIALLVSLVLHNLVLNMTLWELEKNTIWEFVLSFLSFGSAVLLVTNFTGMFEGVNMIYLLLLTLAVACVYARISVWNIGLSGFLVMVALHYVVESFEFGFVFNGGLYNMLAFTFGVFLLSSLLLSIFLKAVQKNVQKNLVNGRFSAKTFALPFVSFIIFPSAYVIIMTAGNFFGWLEIVSIKELFLTYLAYMVLGSHVNFVLSSIQTKKQTHTQTRTVTYSRG